MVMSDQNSSAFQRVVETAARHLVSVKPASGAQFVSTPLLYVSGSTVVVRVERAGNEYFVTDFGAGHLEAEWLGGDAVYKRTARMVAEAAGISFDQFAFFAPKVSEGQIAGAIVSVANCSQEAVLMTSVKVAEKRAKDDAANLYDRLKGLFSPNAVERDAIVLGASHTEWRFASLVRSGRKEVAFEAVTNHPNSIVYAATKFSDLSRVEPPPGRVAVVQNKRQLKTYLGLLTQSASVIEHKSEDDVYRKVLEMAA